MNVEDMELDSIPEPGDHKQEKLQAKRMDRRGLMINPLDHYEVSSAGTTIEVSNLYDGAQAAFSRAVRNNIPQLMLVHVLNGQRTTLAEVESKYHRHHNALGDMKE